MFEPAAQGVGSVACEFVAPAVHERGRECRRELVGRNLAAEVGDLALYDARLAARWVGLGPRFDERRERTEAGAFFAFASALILEPKRRAAFFVVNAFAWRTPWASRQSAYHFPYLCFTLETSGRPCVWEALIYRRLAGCVTTIQ